MTLSIRAVAFLASLLLGASTQPAAVGAPSPQPSAVLVELFTSEGCSSCPPADALLRQMDGRRTPAGQLIVGLSEHVSYWDGLGWKDPYSSELSTRRQNEYSARFGLEGPYTPQMVVNGREQLVGSDARALEAALADEAARPAIDLHIASARSSPQGVTFTYSATGLPATEPVQLVAVLVDDADRSSVLRGENSGRELIHVSVARAFAPLGALRQTAERTVTLPPPPAPLAGNPVNGGHHLVLFAQQQKTLAIVGVDTKAF